MAQQNQGYDKRRNDGREITKISQDIKQIERKNSFRRLRLQAVCSHSDGPRQFDLVAKNGPNGTKEFVCRKCGASLRLKHISDEDCSNAVNTVNEMINFTKMMLTASAKDIEVQKHLADLQYNLNVYAIPAYTTAIKMSRTKGGNRNGGSNNRNGGARLI